MESEGLTLRAEDIFNHFKNGEYNKVYEVLLNVCE